MHKQLRPVLEAHRSVSENTSGDGPVRISCEQKFEFEHMSQSNALLYRKVRAVVFHSAL